MNNTVKNFEQFDVDINFEKIVLSTCFYFKFVKLKKPLFKTYSIFYGKGYGKKLINIDL